MQKITLRLHSGQNRPEHENGIVLTDYLFFVLVLTIVLERYIGFTKGPEGGEILFFVILVLLISY